MYEIEYQEQALLDIAKLKRDEPAAYKKVVSFIQELKEHPKTGTGHPEPLKGKPEGRWSRQISKKHRLVYRIYETEVVVLVIAAYGHYQDKYNPTSLADVKQQGQAQAYFFLLFASFCIFICIFQKKVVPLQPQRFWRYYDSFIT